jgi:excisionase family DNA binding protein
MSVTINGKKYFRTTEVCERVGVSRSTLLRWLGNGVLSDAEHRDRRDWRIFTEDEVQRIEAEANKVK